MSDALRFIVHYSDGGDGWVMAQIEEIPGAQSQGRTREEARANVLDALRLALSVDRPVPHDADHESLDLPLAS
jgi:predicted RNase H-like HicB family nuclease